MALSTILPAAPGQIGSYEAFWLLIFTLLGVTQVDLLLAIGVVSHLIMVLSIIIVGCLGVVWLGLSFGEIFTFKKRLPPRSHIPIEATEISTNKKNHGK